MRIINKLNLLMLLAAMATACGSRENAVSDGAVADSQIVDSGESGQRTNHLSASKPSRQLAIKDASCQYQLNNQAGNDYSPLNMTDGKSATAWAAPLDKIDDYYDNGMIVGPVFYLAEPARITGVALRNGYCKNNVSFRNNSRASWVLIYRYHPEYDGETGEDQMMGFIEDADIIYEGSVQDNMELQYFPAGKKFDNSQTTAAVGLIFRHGWFYRGEKWNDLCLSEIKIFGS